MTVAFVLGLTSQPYLTLGWEYYTRHPSTLHPSPPPPSHPRPPPITPPPPSHHTPAALPSHPRPLLLFLSPLQSSCPLFTPLYLLPFHLNPSAVILLAPPCTPRNPRSPSAHPCDSTHLVASLMCLVFSPPSPFSPL
jgi:hypothetical protein